jgi:RNA:NAD 2'-phosphotransferase (TPT1/KptA family)
MVNMDKRLITVSKYLSKHPRRAPHELGLELQPGGWVQVDDLLTAAERNDFQISYDDLVECVETNDKQRYAFDVSGERIRANQGHSVEGLVDGLRATGQYVEIVKGSLYAVSRQVMTRRGSSGGEARAI